MFYKLFYIVYNAYYKHGEFKNDIPSLTVAGIFVIFFFCLALSVHAIARMFVPEVGGLHASRAQIVIALLSGLLLYYFLFINSRKYIKIYETYRDNEFLNSIFAKFIAFSLVVFTILLPIALALIGNKVRNGRWY